MKRRWVDSITLSDDAGTKGSWEQVGYPNDADVTPQQLHGGGLSKALYMDLS